MKRKVCRVDDIKVFIYRQQTWGEWTLEKAAGRVMGQGAWVESIWGPAGGEQAGELSEALQRYPRFLQGPEFKSLHHTGHQMS